MHLSNYDIAQLDVDILMELDQPTLRSCLEKIVPDFKEAADRLQQNSSNSSRPPSSDDPWRSRNGSDSDSDQPESKDEKQDPEKEKIDSSNQSDSADDDKTCPGSESSDQSDDKRKRGRQPGSQGFGRTQQLPVDQEVVHRPSQCVCCDTTLEAMPFETRTARFEIDLQKEEGTSLGLKLICTKHTYGEVVCPCCSHRNLSMPAKAPEEKGWTVELQEWRLVGPMLVAFICALSKRYRMSRQKIREFLQDWFSLSLSVGEINRCIHEAGRAVSPLEDELTEAIRNADLVHSDETPWWEHTKRLWLWVFTSSTTVLFIVGSRGAAVPKQVLEGFIGWLMSDGYCVYRDWLKRLRCWAHLIRKANGLSESLDSEACAFGAELRDLLSILKESVYNAREGPEVNLEASEQNTLYRILLLCVDHQDSSHKKTRALAHEIMRDWVAVFAVLKHPELPLTNNEAERALRHWVIQRRISMGTRTPEGTRVFTMLASVIETCRKRDVSPWPYLAEVIKERRQGNPCPPLPAAA